MIKNDFDRKAINAMRYIGLKAIQCAKGGHVGMTISAAPITYTLFTKFIKINPNDGKWINRDRFVLSGGHGSMALYPIFYLSGIYSQKDMENFKTENSRTPGHPEFENKKSNFIDASTGPLGQGLATAVGLALAEKHAEDVTHVKFNGLFNNYTYVVCGDGDLQEGISYEAMAIAGRYNLSKLIVLHDSNKYQLDSAVTKVSHENLRLRAESLGWFYLKCSNEPSEIYKCILTAQRSGKPSFIEVDTIIAEGLPVQASNKGHHGCPTDEDIEGFQKFFGTNFKGWDIDPEIRQYFEQTVVQRGLRAFHEWEQNAKNLFIPSNAYSEFEKILKNEVDYKSIFSNVVIDKKDQATRVYLKSFLAALENVNPFAIAICADLVASTNIMIGTKDIFNGGHNLPAGIREFGMGAVMNGFALYSEAMKIIGGTFLVFADYIKPAIRLGALMELPTIYAFTHDSYLVGGDGPTHQPFDQLPMLRAIEHVNVYRPADEEELRLTMIEAYTSKVDTSVIVLSRQNVKSLNNKVSMTEFKKGAYIVKDVKEPDYILAASGAEVQLALEVANELKNARVISVPCLDKAVDMNDADLKSMFSAKKALITIEPSSDYKWFKFHITGQRNIHLGAYKFGKSMDGDKLYKDRGFNKETILKAIK